MPAMYVCEKIVSSDLSCVKAYCAIQKMAAWRGNGFPTLYLTVVSLPGLGRTLHILVPTDFIFL